METTILFSKCDYFVLLNMQRVFFHKKVWNKLKVVVNLLIFFTKWTLL